jgi:hypothetical protein
MKRNKLVRVVPNNKPKIAQNFRETCSQVVSNNTLKLITLQVPKICWRK